MARRKLDAANGVAKVIMEKIEQCNRVLFWFTICGLGSLLLGVLLSRSFCFLQPEDFVTELDAMPVTRPLPKPPWTAECVPPPPPVRPPPKPPKR